MSSEYEYNCEGIYGLTGSGKTTFAMRRACEFAAKGLAVYTNIEYSLDALRHHMLRRYGRHLRHDLPTHEDPAEQERLRRLYRGIPRLHRLFHRIDAADVGRFWRVVPRGPAVVIIDEAQLWFPQSRQHRDEDPEFVTYLTQHRKLRHHVWMISQFPTLLSHSFRKIQHLHWHVQNSRQKAISFGLFSIRCPFEGFAYAGYYHEKKETGHNERVASDLVLACMPGNRWIFDLFDSRELHAGLGDLVGDGGAHASL